MSTVLDKKTERLAIKPPGMFNVVLHNDDYTSMEFVIAVLMQIFNKAADEAVAITQNVHVQGKGIAGRYTREIAETCKANALDAAKANEFPLKITVEAE
jgi:ATP-dependent Clp protease adaptor protein ClpS